MKRYFFLLVFGLMGLVTVSYAQPLLKTHVETGDVEGVADGTAWRYIRPYRMLRRQWATCAGRLHNLPKLGRVSGCVTRLVRCPHSLPVKVVLPT